MISDLDSSHDLIIQDHPVLQDLKRQLDEWVQHCLAADASVERSLLIAFGNRLLRELSRGEPPRLKEFPGDPSLLDLPFRWAVSKCAESLGVSWDDDVLNAGRSDVRDLLSEWRSGVDPTLLKGDELDVLADQLVLAFCYGWSVLALPRCPVEMVQEIRRLWLALQDGALKSGLRPLELMEPAGLPYSVSAPIDIHSSGDSTPPERLLYRLCDEWIDALTSRHSGLASHCGGFLLLHVAKRLRRVVLGHGSEIQIEWLCLSFPQEIDDMIAHLRAHPRLEPLLRGLRLCYHFYQAESCLELARACADIRFEFARSELRDMLLDWLAQAQDHNDQSLAVLQTLAGRLLDIVANLTPDGPAVVVDVPWLPGYMLNSLEMIFRRREVWPLRAQLQLKFPLSVMAPRFRG